MRPRSSSNRGKIRMNYVRNTKARHVSIDIRCIFLSITANFAGYVISEFIRLFISFMQNNPRLNYDFSFLQNFSLLMQSANKVF